MSQITPFVKRMRTQGGTLYTFSSAVEDIGLNINERNNIVKMSNYALLDIPEITSPANLQQNRFNVLGIDGALKNYDNAGNIKDGRVVVAESFQNYALNVETNLLSSDDYNPALLKTVSEKVFWKWLKETGAIRWTDIDTSIGQYWTEETDSDTSTGYNSVVKYVGEISAGSIRTDTFGTYNETYVLVPTSHGQTDVYFKQDYDDNYQPKQQIGPGGNNILGRDSYTQPHPDGLSFLAQYDVTDSSNAIGSWAKTYDANDGVGFQSGSWYTAQGQSFVDDNWYTTDVSTILNDPSAYNYTLNYTKGGEVIEFQRSNVDALTVEYNLNNLKKIYDDDTLTFDKMAIQDSVDDSFDFNAVLIYYTVYNKTLDKILATNLLGILFLNPASGNTTSFPDMEIVIPAITKLQSTSSGFGSAYSFRINIKSDNMIDDTQATIFDESTSSQTALESWTDVFSNLEKSLEILNSHTDTINYITEQYMDISDTQTQQGNTISDLQYQVNDIASDIGGTTDAIAMFSDGDDPLIESSIYMRNGRVGVFTNNPDPSFNMEIDGDVKVNEITIENAIRDTSGNILLGYGSPLQIGSDTNYREVYIYNGSSTPIMTIDTSGNVNIDASTFGVTGDIAFDGDVDISGAMQVDGSFDIYGYVPEASFNGSPDFEWAGQFLEVNKDDFMMEASFGAQFYWLNGLLATTGGGSGSSFLSELLDVSITGTPQDGSILSWNSSESYWMTDSIQTTLEGLSDTNIGTPVNGQALTFDGANWINGYPSGGDVNWANGNHGTSDAILTSGGDGSIWSESWLTADYFAKELALTGIQTIDGSLSVSDGVVFSGTPTGTPIGGYEYLYVDAADGNKLKRAAATTAPGSGLTFSGTSNVSTRLVTATGTGAILGEVNLTFDGSILEFAGDINHTIQMKDDPTTPANHFYIKGAKGLGYDVSLNTTTRKFYYTPNTAGSYTKTGTTPRAYASVPMGFGQYVTAPTFTTTNTANGNIGKEGGDVDIKAGAGGDAVGGATFNYGGVGGDLLLSAGAGGTGSTSNGSMGNILIDGAITTIDSDYIDIPYRLRHLGNTAIYQEFNTDRISWEYSNVNILQVEKSVGVVINEDGNFTHDFRVESDSNNHMLFVDAGANAVGINNNNPSEELDVSGNIKASGNIEVEGSITSLSGTTTATSVTPITASAGEIWEVRGVQTGGTLTSPGTYGSWTLLFFYDGVYSQVDAVIIDNGSSSSSIVTLNKTTTTCQARIVPAITMGGTFVWSALRVG